MFKSLSGIIIKHHMPKYTEAGPICLKAFRGLL